MLDIKADLNGLNSYSQTTASIDPVIDTQEDSKSYPKRYYEDKAYRELVDAIEKGIEDYKQGRVSTEEDLWDQLEKLRSKKNNTNKGDKHGKSTIIQTI